MQNILVRQITKKISKELHAEVSVKNVGFHFFNKMNIKGLLLKDLQQDTLLYAGGLKLRITDWFFFKDQVELKYIAFENIQLHLNRRKDSTWNYHFLNKALHLISFDSKNSTQLNLKKIDAENIDIYYDDAWIGTNMHIKLGWMHLAADKVDWKKKNIALKQLLLANPEVMIKDYTGLRPQTIQNNETATLDELYFNKANVSLSVEALKLTKGKFHYINATRPYQKTKPNTFDERNILINNIHLKASDYLFFKDTMRANIVLSAKEQCGIEIKKLKADFLLTPHIMEYKNMLLETNNSRVTDYYSMNFERNFLDDITSYIDRTVMKANLKKCSIATDDIAFFAPALAGWKKYYSVDAQFVGTVNDFKINQLSITGKNNFFVSADVHMKGLPDYETSLNQFFIKKLQTSTDDIAFFAPIIHSVKSPDMRKLGTLHYKGSFTGLFRNFALAGELRSDLGSAFVDLQMQLPQQKQSTYSGFVQTEAFDIGALFANPMFGKIGFTGDIDGQGFDLKNIKSLVNGHFDYLTFNKYTYHNIEVNGEVQKKFFTGNINVLDSNLVFRGNLQVDFKDEVPKYAANGVLEHLNLQKTGIAQKNINIASSFSFQFRGKHIDDFWGSAFFQKIHLQSDTLNVILDSFYFLSIFDDLSNKRLLSTASSQFEALAEGKFSIIELPTIFQTFFHKYYPAIVPIPQKNIENQELLFSIKTKKISPLWRLFSLPIDGFENTLIKGRLHTKHLGEISIQAQIPWGKINGYKFEDIDANVQGNYIFLDTDLKAKTFIYGREKKIPNVHLTITSNNNLAIVHLLTGGNNSINEINLNADVYTLSDGFRINFKPSFFVLNKKKWFLEKEGELFIGKTFASAKNVKFSQNNQSLIIESDKANFSDLILKIKNLQIEDFMPMIVKKEPSLRGSVNGQVRLMNFYATFKADAHVTLDNFFFENDSIGKINLFASYDKSVQKIVFKTESLNKEYDFSTEGHYQFAIKDSLVQAPLHINLKMRDAKISVLSYYLKDIFSSFTGQAKGDIIIDGGKNKYYLAGDVRVTNAALTTNYTKVHYLIDSASVRLTKDYIDIGTIGFKDVYNNAGRARGKLKYNGFQKLEFDFSAHSHKILVIDNALSDTENFYGKAFAKAHFSAKGSQDSIHLDLKVEVADSSQIYIPTTASKTLSSADYMFFVQKKVDKKAYRPALLKLNTNVDITVNRLAEIHVILDPITGDVVKSRGEGNLRIWVPSTGDITMKGRYKVAMGKYDFKFQSFIEKPFEFKETGNNYIEWHGSPYDAKLHLDAEYTATNVNIEELISQQSSAQLYSNNAIKRYRGDVYVIVQLRGQLAKPDIGFKLDFPQGSAIKSDQDFTAFLNKLSSDDNEMLKQVSYLIIFNSFAPYAGQTNFFNIASLGANSLSQIITNYTNDFLSKQLYKITGDRSLKVDISNYSYSNASFYGLVEQNNAIFDRSIIKARISKSMLNGRVIVTFGNNFDFNLNNTTALTTESSFQWLPDVSVQVILSKDNKLRMLVFNKSNLGIAGTSGNIGRHSRQGISFSYSNDFDSIFMKKRSQKL